MKKDMKLCYRNNNCKKCPLNEKCDKEIITPVKKEKEYIHIDLSNFYKKKETKDGDTIDRGTKR